MPISTSNSLVVAQHAVKLSNHGVTGKAGQAVSFTTTVTRDDGTTLANATITYTVDGVTVGTAVSNSSGVATLSYTIPAGTAIGAHTFSMTFAVDTADKSETASNTLTVTQ